MVCIILNKEEYEDDLLSVMMELEITGATILDGVGMERVFKGCAHFCRTDPVARRVQAL